MLKRVASLLLCLLFAASSVLLVACGGEEEESSKSEVQGNTDGFLNEARKWDETINILGYNGEFIYHTIQIEPENGSSGEPVSDAVFERNAFIEQQYGLNIEVIVPTAEQDPIAMIKNDVSANTGEFDVIINPINWMISLLTEDMIYDFTSIDNGYLHLDQEWWDQDLQEDLALNGRVYFLAGDAVLEDDEATWAIFFNKDMFQNNAALAEYGDIYQIVRDGKWTLDTLYEMIQHVDKTVGDEKTYKGALEADGDQFGMVVQMYDFYLFMQGCEQTIIDNTGELPEMRIMADENVATFNALCEIMHNTQYVGIAEDFGAWNSGVYEEKKQIFAAGNALFLPSQLGTIGQAVMRDADIRYGIIPMPKRNELQEQYTTSVEVYHYSAIAIPLSNVAKLDATCYALEAMAYYGNKMVTPEYYDRTLTYKRFADEESGEMIEIIYNNKIYDMGAVFNFSAGDNNGTLGFYTNLFGGKSTNISSAYEASANMYQAGIEDFIAKCYDLN